MALVSDNFERDEKSSNLLMYTMDTLNKAYIIVVIRPNLSWTNTDLGMRIGKQEVEWYNVWMNAMRCDMMINLFSRNWD